MGFHIFLAKNPDFCMLIHFFHIVIEVRLWRKWIIMQKLGFLLKKFENPLKFWILSKMLLFSFKGDLKEYKKTRQP